MFYIDQSTKETKRFLVGPVGCEITGLAYTPDLTTFFVNIQHPTGDWPVAGEEPRSSTVVVRRTDGKRSDEHTSELQSLIRISYSFFFFTLSFFFFFFFFL